MSLNLYQPILIEYLEAYRAFDAAESAHLRQILTMLKTEDKPFSRSTLAGHITASAVLVDDTRSSIAVVWHEKLGRWLQPGGHAEPELDSTLPDAARRELLEETGIPAEQITLLDESPFDVDVHPIPARGQEPAHFHYDIRYLFQASRSSLNGNFKWMPLDELLTWEDASMNRFARKLLQQSNP